MVSNSTSSQEVLDGGALSEELVGGLLDSSLRDLVVKVETSDGSVLTGRGGAREGEHDALGDVVKLAVGLEADGLPLVRSENPVAHVINGSVASRGSR